MIKFVLLDVDNTLLDFDKCAEASIKSSCQTANIAFFDNMIPTFHEINNELWLGIEKGIITKSQLHKNRWNLIFQKLGISFDGETFEKYFLDNLAKSAEPVAGAHDLLEYLYKKYRLFTASNAFYNQQTSRLTKAGMLKYIEGMFISEKIGHEKPSKEFFDESFSQMGNPNKDEVIIIGDSLSADICGGAEYGIKTCWYNPHNITPDDDCPADYIVKTLQDIKNIL